MDRAHTSTTPASGGPHTSLSQLVLLLAPEGMARDLMSIAFQALVPICAIFSASVQERRGQKLTVLTWKHSDEGSDPTKP